MRSIETITLINNFTTKLRFTSGYGSVFKLTVKVFFHPSQYSLFYFFTKDVSSTRDQILRVYEVLKITWKI